MGKILSENLAIINMGIKYFYEALEMKTTSLFIVTDKYEKKLCRPSNGSITLSEPIDSDVKFAYIKAVKGIGRFSAICAVTNPIYFNQNKEELNWARLL